MSRLSFAPLRAVPLLLLATCGGQQPTAAPAASPAPTTAMPLPPATAPATQLQPGPDNRTALLLLAPYVTQLAKAPALQADTQVQQLSQQLLTEATTLEQAPATASLQPTLRTLVSLLQAAQQRAYPSLAAPTRQLAAAAQPLSGQPTTPAEQAQYYQVIGQASDLLKQFIAQMPGAHR